MNEDFRNLRFALYARKSSESEDRQAKSIESQLEEMRKLSNIWGYKIVRTFTDSASAHKPRNRTGYFDMIEALKSGAIDGIITWKADRLSRNAIEGGELIHLLQTGDIQVIQTASNRFLPIDNIMPLTFEFGMANQYSIDLSRNVKRGNRTKISNGGHCGLAPAGYLNDLLEKTVIPDPERFALVRKMWDLYLSGAYSISQICKIADKEWGFRTIKRKKSGGAKMSESSLHKIFMNPFYYGKVKKGGNENWGTHKPMILQREFEEVQRLLKREGKPRGIRHDFAFTGCLKCGGCDGFVTAEEKVKYACPKCRKQHSARTPRDCSKCGHKISAKVISKGNWYIYYRCTKKKDTNCREKYVREEILESQIIEALKEVEIDPDFEKWSIKWLKYLNQENAHITEKQFESLQKTFNQVQKKLSQLLDMRLEGDLDKTAFEFKKQELEKERDELEEELKIIKDDSDDWIEEAEEEYAFIQGICERLKNGTLKEKKYILKRIGSNLSLKDQKLSIELKEPYFLIKKVKDNKPDRLEPPNSPSTRGQRGIRNQSYPLWLGMRDSNPRMLGPKPSALPLGDAPSSDMTPPPQAGP